MALCGDLETKLKQQRDHADRLAQAVVNAVVTLEGRGHEHRKVGEILNQMVDNPRGADILNHMVKDQSKSLDRVFHALAHPARRAMLRQLTGGARNLSELAAPFRMSFPAASKHVRVLERARLLRRHVVGRTHWCRIEAEPLGKACDFLENYRRFWEESFERLEDVLEELKTLDEQRGRVIRPKKGDA